MVKEKNNKKYKKVSKEYKEVIRTCIFVLSFILVAYLLLFGLSKLGLFDKGYTKSESDTTISGNNILIGETFNREESEYYVLFADLSKYSSNSYIKSILEKNEINTYYVDMSYSYNSKYLSDDGNRYASDVDSLKINGTTLIKIINGSISEYIEGNEQIEEYLQ